MSRRASKLLALVSPERRPEESPGDAWWRGCLLRARAIREQLPVLVARPAESEAVQARERERQKKIEDFLSRTP
jgi:predicted amidohydrolase